MTDLPVGAQVNAFAVCPAGMVVTGGGAFTTSTDPGVAVIRSDWVQTGSVPDAWVVTMDNAGTTATEFIADAICTQATEVNLAVSRAALSARRAAEK